jgi:hypothetical protein
MVKYLSFHNFSFALRFIFQCKWQGHNVTHTLQASDHLVLMTLTFLALARPSRFDDAHFFGIGATLHLVSTLSPYLAKPRTRKP